MATLVPPHALPDGESASPVRNIELRAHHRLIERMDAAGRTPAPFETDGCSGGLSAWASSAFTSLPVGVKIAKRFEG